MQLAQLRQSRSRGGLRDPPEEAAGLAPHRSSALTARPPWLRGSSRAVRPLRSALSLPLGQGTLREAVQAVAN